MTEMQPARSCLAIVLAAGEGTRMKSQRPKVLHEVGLLDRTKRGVWVYYSVRREALADLEALIGGVAG